MNGMNELNRNLYLEAIGIDIYVPRLRLAGAAESPLLPMCDASLSSLDNADDKMFTERFSGNKLVGSVKEDGETPVLGQSNAAADAVVQEGRSSSPAGAGSDQVVRFTLNVWQLSPKLMIIDSHQPKSGLPSGALLRNILLVKNLEHLAAAPQAIHWPVLKGDTGRSTLAQARDFVSAFIHSRLEEKPVEGIWLLGQAAFQTLADPIARFEDHLGMAISLPGFANKGLVLPSLHDMLRNPELKKKCWLALNSAGLDNE